MPEYLSPAVYVEEVNAGPRPIEGVSTSTAATLGVTERGPENIPVLCTSIGDYRRVFGGDLNPRNFVDPQGQAHGYTSQAVKAFFENGGRRDYVERVLPEDARHATRLLFDRGDPSQPDTILLRGAPQDSGTALNTPRIYALQQGIALAANQTLRIGNGSRSEYFQISALGAEVHVALGLPLVRSHAAGTTVEEIDRTINTADYSAGTFSLNTNAGAGNTKIDLIANGAAADAAALLALPGIALFEIGTHPRSEYRFATAAVDLGGGVVRLTLATPLSMDHANSADTNAIDIPAPPPLTSQLLSTPARAGDSLIYLDDLDNGFPDGAGDKLVIIAPGMPQMEVHRLGVLGNVTLDLGAYQDYPAGTRLERVMMAVDDRALGAGTETVFTVDRVDGLAIGMQIAVDGNPPVIIDAIDIATNTITTRTDALPAAPAGGEAVVPLDKTLTADAAAGAVVIALDNRLGLVADDVLRIGTGAGAEYATVAVVLGGRGAPPDAGTLALTAPLSQDHAAGVTIRRMTPPNVDTAHQPAFAVIGSQDGTTDIFAADAGALGAGDIVAVTPPNTPPYYHEIGAADLTLTAVELELSGALEFSHDIGAPVVGRTSLINVVALDRGAWGNRVRLAVREPQTPLAQANLTGSSPLNPIITLSNYSGIEPGSVLEFFDPATGNPVGALSKVIDLDRAAGEVTLDAVPDPAVTGAVVPLSVRSREFEIIVYLLRQPDPAVPTRNETVIDSETFLVSMDPRHSRYIHRIIGTTWVTGAEEDDDGTPLRGWDNRSEGESGYIRVRDVDAGNIAATHAIRMGPEPLQDVLVTGQLRPARMPMTNGDDAVALMGNAMYLGVDSNEPRLRTGIHALANVRTISIVAVPGITSLQVQQALVSHCERDRYRFAVLDGPPPPGDTLVGVQSHRQALSSSYAALYHPWVTIPDPMPGNLASIQQVALPPSGHVMGIYARTDNTRGVHKAPANEVVRNITGLTRYLNQREQDMLNPFPTNINAIRWFGDINRSTRVWGARTLSADSQWKYINVRRLFIFVEASIEQGLQYAVFEPNAEALWRQVRRSIENFLTVAWRNGALEGTAPEQAFFVRCDRTTMTQTDIDEGRLICLVGIAPVRPAEFVVIQISQKTRSTDE